eukprot:augustus_masked-scaffold_3-processed-gene-6.69-mRNA-1 protein AED:1.00 eAED:1.00 QI:0/0/0/0/1/1/4/0/398
MTSNEENLLTAPSGGPSTLADAESKQSEQMQASGQPQGTNLPNQSSNPSQNPDTPANRPRTFRTSPDSRLLGTEALEQLRISQREGRAVERADKLFEDRLNSLRKKEAQLMEIVKCFSKCPIRGDVRSITLMAYDVQPKEHVKISGLANIGADRNRFNITLDLENAKKKVNKKEVGMKQRLSSAPLETKMERPDEVKVLLYRESTHIAFRDEILNEIRTYHFLAIDVHGDSWYWIFETMYANNFRLEKNIIYKERNADLGGNEETRQYSKLRTIRTADRFLLSLNEDTNIKFSHQKNNNVHLEVDNIVGLLQEVISEILIGKMYIDISRVKAVPIEEVNTEHFNQLEDKINRAEVLPIAITNVVDDIPEELNELGIGEGNIFASEEKQLIDDMIKQKL